ncbi:MAG: helix-turn-helix domain-containing protein [Hyphomicrobiaceae bacterium]|nr:helix-turn-helix domain-containing protein [Hyphomicrobiaceae bacterium]
MANAAVAENLRLLTSYYKSVAEACRQLGINRQQFNKYLSGHTAPSRHTLQRICDFFGVEDYELLLPADEFRELVALKPSRASGPVANGPAYMDHIDRLIHASRGDAERYCGYYFAYRYSFSDSGALQKSLVRFWREDERILSKRVERFQDRDGEEVAPFLCKYLGTLLLLRDRIYVIEYDALRRQEVSQTILYPGYRSRLTWLSGLNMGVSTRDDRRIGCGRVLYQHLGRTIDLRRALGQLGKFETDSDQVPDMVRETLCEGVSGSPSDMLFAVPL